MALRVIWQYMDRSVTKKYYMDRSFESKTRQFSPGPYNTILTGCANKDK